MGCCCSNSKIQPQTEIRQQELNRRVIHKESVFAAPTLAVTDLKNTNEKSMRAFAFGDRRKKFQIDKESVQDESSGEEVTLEFKDIRTYNEEIAQRDRKRKGLEPVKSKVPKSKGFDFPIFPPLQGEDSSVTASSAVASAALAAQALKKEDKKKTGDENANKYQLNRLPVVQSRGQPAVITAHNTGLKSGRSKMSSSPSSLKSQDRLHYKKIDYVTPTEGNDDEYTTLLSSDEEDEPDRRKRRKQEKKIVKVNLKNTGTQYYEQTYTRSKQSFKSSSRPSSQTFTDENMNNVIEDRKSRQSNHLRSRPSTAHKGKATKQRLLDSYLAQPKVLIVPVIRDYKKKDSDTVLKNGHNKHTRRILKKPWRNNSMNLPMMRESGTGSSNIRFAMGVRVRTFDDQSDAAFTDTDTSSSGNAKPSKKKVRVPVQAQTKSGILSRDKVNENFALERYIEDTSATRNRNSKRHREPIAPATVKATTSKNLGAQDRERRTRIDVKDNDEYYLLKGPSGGGSKQKESSRSRRTARRKR